MPSRPGSHLSPRLVEKDLVAARQRREEAGQELAEEVIPRQSVLQLIPRRSLWKALILLLLLFAIVCVQQRSDVVLRQLGGVVSPATDRSTPPASPPSAPAVRLSPSRQSP